MLLCASRLFRSANIGKPRLAAAGHPSGMCARRRARCCRTPTPTRTQRAHTLPPPAPPLRLRTQTTVGALPPHPSLSNRFSLRRRFFGVRASLCVWRRASVSPRHAFGIKSDIGGTVCHVDEMTVVYAVGCNVVVLDTEQKTQRFIPRTGSDSRTLRMASLDSVPSATPQFDTRAFNT